MAKSDLLDETEVLLKALVKEANLAASPDDGGPDFADRLKVVDAVSKFLVVKNKLVPPEKGKSIFEELQDDLHGGKTGSRAGTAPKGKGRNGTAHLAAGLDDGDI
jgi:hypothetical protein